MYKVEIVSGSVGLVILIVGILLTVYGIPKIVEDQISENVALINGTSQFKRFENLPVPLQFDVYIFNIVNKNEANKGKEPTFKEAGPYVYKQTRHKDNIELGPNNISYYEYSKFEFDQEASKNLTQNDEITVINPALLGTLQIMEYAKLDILLEFLDLEVIKTVFGVDDIYLETTVHDFLFGGYEICDFDQINQNTDPVLKTKATIICTGLLVLKTKNIRLENRKLVFTFLNHKNITHNGLHTINSGVDNIHKLGLIEKWENKKYLSNWVGKTSSCNKVTGRDAVIFEPLMKDPRPLTVFNTDICRTVDLKFTKELKIREADAREYELPEDTFTSSADCYCLNKTKGNQKDGGCLLEKGVLELFSCYNAPIVLSFPHFLWADKKLLYSIEGLNPIKEKHRTYAHIEPKTGTPLSGSKRVQFNMFVKKIDGLKANILDKYRVVRLMPILWLDEHFDINDELYNILYESYLSKLPIITGVTWGVNSLGIVIIIISLEVVICKLKGSKQTV